MDAQEYLADVSEKLAAQDEAYHLRIEVKVSIRTDAPPVRSTVLTDTARGDLADLEIENGGARYRITMVDPKPSVPYGVAKVLLDCYTDDAEAF
jgi:hypothetical protein